MLRDPFFDGMTHDDDDDDEEEDGIYFDGSQGGGGQQDLFDNQWRFGFSMGPNGVRIQEPEMFGQFFREMEIFSQLGRYDGQFGVGQFGRSSQSSLAWSQYFFCHDKGSWYDTKPRQPSDIPLPN